MHVERHNVRGDTERERYMCRRHMCVGDKCMCRVSCVSGVSCVCGRHVCASRHKCVGESPVCGQTYVCGMPYVFEETQLCVGRPMCVGETCVCRYTLVGGIHVRVGTQTLFCGDTSQRLTAMHMFHRYDDGVVRQCLLGHINSVSLSASVSPHQSVYHTWEVSASN